MTYFLRESDKEDVVDANRTLRRCEVGDDLDEGISKLCNKPWEGMFSFFVFSVSCHFVLNVGFFSFEIGVVWASFSSYQWDYGYCWRSKTRTLQIHFSVQGLAIVNTFKCTIQKRFCIACSDSCFKF